MDVEAQKCGGEEDMIESLARLACFIWLGMIATLFLVLMLISGSELWAAMNETVDKTSAEDKTREKQDQRGIQ